ncbi:MAG TPA: hypothetical protein VGN01_11360 [Acidobacteriaceae bacterium]|jgi:hypothetical protein
MNRVKALRLQAAMSMAVACVGAACFLLDGYLLAAYHRSVARLVLLPVYGLGMYVWGVRYRQLSVQIARHASAADSD